MKNYTREDYLDDLKNPEMLHLKSKERFKAFYEMLGTESIQKVQQVVLERFNFIVPKGKIIELGCHAGFQCIAWSEQGFKCLGVDIAQSLIDEANGRVDNLQHPLKGEIEFMCSDILDLDSNKLGTFDTIVLTETLEHVVDPDPIFEKAVSFMDISSVLYVAAPSTRVGTYSHVRGVSEDYVKKMAKKFNLLVEFKSSGGNTRAILKRSYL